MNQQQREPEKAAPDSGSEKQAQPQKATPNHDQDLLDEGIEESFPASDSPAVSHID